MRTTFEAATGLTVAITKSDRSVEVDHEITCKVLISNQGVAPATRVALTVTLPPELALASNDAIVAPLAATAKRDDAGREVTFSDITLPGPSTVEYSLRLRVLAATGDARLKAVVRSDALSKGPLPAQESIMIAAK